MSDTVKVNRNEIELSEEILTSFAKFLVPEIRKFYQSEEGKAYYEKWLKCILNMPPKFQRKQSINYRLLSIHMTFTKEKV